MEVCDDLLETKKCFKCNYNLLDNLNVTYNSANSMFIFWNKYQLLLFENLNFEDASRIFIPEFVVHQILISNSYLVCLDCSGNIHITSLKFKNSAQKRLKTNFQPREQNIMACVQRGERVLSLKSECDAHFLCLNRINTVFQREKKVKIKYESETWPLTKTCQENCLITSYTVPESDVYVKQLLNKQDNIYRDYELVVISLDKKDIFACLFSSNMIEEEVKMMKLYSCPSEICDMQIVESNEVSLVIVLTSGSIIKLPLVKTCLDPVPIHLNTAVSKFIASKDTVTYTDGISMWRTENTYGKIKFNQFFLRHVKDFVRFGDQMLCTTYSNLIYVIPADDEMNYLKSEYEEFVPVEKLLNNSEYLMKLLEEVDRNNELIERVSEEGNYITALALSNRPDLMDTMLENTLLVYEHYEDAIKENPEITLTEELKEYFKADVLFVLVKITTMQMEYLLNEVLGQLFQNSRIHLSLFTENKLLKNNSIEMPKSLKSVTILVPLDSKQISEVCTARVNIKIVTNVPGAFDSKEPVWTTLYLKEITLNSEQFIKTNMVSSKNICLKDHQENIENLIVKAAENMHGNVFKFTDIKNVSRRSPEFALYVKLPANYTEILQDKEIFTSRFSVRKAMYLSEQFSSEEFLKSKNNLIFEVGKFKVDIEILMDEHSPALRVASENAHVALNMRNFLAELIYDEFKMHGPAAEFVDYGFYTATENLLKAIKDARNSDPEDLQLLTDQFQKSIVGGLPL